MRNSKRILICSSAFFPENSPRSFRASELARELSKCGNDVKVITIDRGEETQVFCRDNRIQVSFVNKLKFKPLTLRFTMLTRIVNRILLMLFEYPDIELTWKFSKALKFEAGYDLLISIAVPYPVHWGVAMVRSKKNMIGKAWIADCGDPYMGNRIDSFKKLFYFGFIEKWTFGKADYISIPISSARDAYYPEFRKKIRIIPQGINFTEARACIEKYVPNQITTFGYAGSFIPGNREPRKLLRYLNTLNEPFRLIIYSNMFELIAEEVANSAGRILVCPYIPRLQLIRELSKLDFLLNIENSTSTQAPSKLIDYYLAARPVLSIDGNNPEKDQIHRFLSGDFSTAISMDGYEQFDIGNVAAKFLALA